LAAIGWQLPASGRRLAARALAPIGARRPAPARAVLSTAARIRRPPGPAS